MYDENKSLINKNYEPIIDMSIFIISIIDQIYNFANIVYIKRFCNTFYVTEVDVLAFPIYKFSYGGMPVSAGIDVCEVGEEQAHLEKGK